MLRGLVQLLAGSVDAGQRAGAETVLQLLGNDLKHIGGEVGEGGLKGIVISITRDGRKGKDVRVRKRKARCVRLVV